MPTGRHPKISIYCFLVMSPKVHFLFAHHLCDLRAPKHLSYFAGISRTGETTKRDIFPGWLQCKLVDSLSSASKDFVGSDFFIWHRRRLVCKIRSREVFGYAPIRVLYMYFRRHHKEAVMAILGSRSLRTETSKMGGFPNRARSPSWLGCPPCVDCPCTATPILY